MSLYCLKSDTENGLLTLPKGKWQRYIQVFLLPKGLTLVANIQQTLVAKANIQQRHASPFFMKLFLFI